MEKVLLIQNFSGFMTMVKVNSLSKENVFRKYKIIAMHKIGSPQIEWSKKIMEKNNEKFFIEQNFFDERRQAFA